MSVEIEMQKHESTADAVLMSPDGERKSAVWLPKSQIEMQPLGRARYTVTMPEWLAIDKGLV